MPSFELAKLYQPLFSTKARYIDLWGGRGRGGSFTGTQYALHLLTCPGYFRGYFMREIFADVRESLWRDFKDRITENETLREEDFDINESQMTACYKPTGNMIISKGFKKSAGNRTAKLKSIAGATHVFIEEFDEISESDFNQLDDSLRTVKGNIQVVRIFNPPHKNHWLWKKSYTLQDHPTFNGYFTAIPKNDPSLLSIHSTYRDNLANLNESFITKLLSYQETDPDYYHLMVEGLISEGAKGRIYRNWNVCPHLPGLYEKFYGLDFGFNDPVALVEMEHHNRDLWCGEKLYEKGLTNKEISDHMTSLGIKKTAKIYADSAEPKSIRELRLYGWNIIEADKGPDSILSGIKMIKDYNVHVTEGSKNLWHENENYKWALDQQKNPTNVPVDMYNHLMDAIRYGFVTRMRKPKSIRII
jgi:phage terminase large subunit